MNPIGMIFGYSIFYFIPVLIITGILHFTWKSTKLKFFLWVKRIIFWPCFLIFLLFFGFSGFYIAKDIVTKIPYREHVSGDEITLSFKASMSGGQYYDYFISQDDLVLEEIEHFSFGLSLNEISGVKLRALKPGKAVVVLTYGSAGGGSLSRVYIYDVNVDDSMDISYEKQLFYINWDDRKETVENIRQMLIDDYGCTPEEIEIIHTD
ncbi:hypothetical protein [Pseudobutyrivibrio sp. LB2011]|uniref:hypothetical protein n=1 Tax=Pseudobutyrivibrio sp. LB2011 TaxID=1408312 RepID=UPI0005D18ADE|nr:hypothetical protein [Pseudobutyrivibrio sp. LB2011]